jgi:hypothetical protein
MTFLIAWIPVILVKIFSVLSSSGTKWNEYTHPRWYGQRGPKVTSLVACSSRGRCTQHLRRIRGCDAHPAWIWRICHANVTRKIRVCDVRHVARVHHVNVARTCRARSAQQGMLLLGPSVSFWIKRFLPLVYYFKLSRCRSDMWSQLDQSSVTVFVLWPLFIMHNLLQVNKCRGYASILDKSPHVKPGNYHQID